MSKLKIGNILFNIAAIITLILFAFVIFNIATGTKGYAVTSRSMATTLERGDIVFSRKVSFDELKVGDIITVGSTETGEYFTHRIVEINEDSKTVTTKGDNNTENDPMDTSAERIVGRMWYSIPLLGYITIGFGTISQTNGLIILAVIAVVLVVINTAASHIKTKKSRGDNDE
jgi:signal peptidase I